MPFFTFINRVFNFLALKKGLKVISLKVRNMNRDIFTSIKKRDETKPLLFFKLFYQASDS
ncbi:hypothetical protein BH713_08790 [Enterobacter kobei]|uniref:Uncharacterized protein n=1 Tax=Enterobacter kobei TaxID=208224 RepID=A0ACC8SB29_9ENTR|nr:hypothetical protein BH713_08790 [Enterobacter kobei]